jgi:hypothetical protein
MRNIPRLDAPQGRAGNAITCATCGKRLCPKRGSRRMRFCGVACRQSAFCAKKWAWRTAAVTISWKYARRIKGLQRRFWGSRIGHSRPEGRR